MVFIVNSRATPPSFWPIPSRRLFVGSPYVRNLPAMSNFFDRRVKLLLVIVGLGVGISFLFSIHRDVGIGAAIIASYGGLY
jgi:hypothetical protein